MPFLHLITTISRSQIPENFGPSLARVLSSAMRNKPPEKIAVHVSPDQYMSLGLKENIPMALIYIRAIGSLDPDDNRKIVKEVTQFINSKLAIDPLNIRMVMENLHTDTIGANGQLVADMTK